MALDPDIADYLRRVAELDPQPLAAVGAVRARENYRAGMALRQAPGYVAPRMASVEAAHVSAPDLDGSVDVRVYEPDRRIAATVVFFHGGGWVIGDLETHDAQCRHLADATRARVVAVDYRRAPEHPYPQPLGDCLAAVLWAAERWPGDRLAVAGDSAGGALAAGCALELRDAAGVPSLAAQLLIYPATDPALRRPSVVANDAGYGLSRDDMAWFIDQYLPEPAMRRHPAADLVSRRDLEGAPPAVVAVARYDILHDEGAEYAEHLADAGVAVQLIDAPGLIHGFWGLRSISAAAARTVDEAEQAFAALLA